jgi:very-short-patch-repair endonuclease
MGRGCIESRQSPLAPAGRGRRVRGAKFQGYIVKRNNISKARDLRKNQTDAEQKLWAVLRDRSLAGVKFRRQFPIENYILDFYSSDIKLCIEADSGQHYTEEGKLQDDERAKVLAKFGIQILRFSDRDILKNIDGVCDVIFGAIKRNRPPSPQSSPLGERM